MVSSGRPRPSGCPSMFRGPGGPLLGEHAHELLHPTPPSRAPVRTAGHGQTMYRPPRRRRGVVDALHRRRSRHRDPAAHHRRRPSGRTGARPSSRRFPAGFCAVATHGDQHGPGIYWPRRASTWSCPRPTTWARSWTSPVGTRASACRSGTTVTDGLWLREGRGGRPGTRWRHARRAGHARLRHPHRHGARCPRGVERQQRALRVERDLPSSARRSAAASCCSPGEVVLGRGRRRYTTPWVVSRRPDDGLDGLAAALHTYERSLAGAPGRPNRSCSTSGRRCGSTTT